MPESHPVIKIRVWDEENDRFIIDYLMVDACPHCGSVSLICVHKDGNRKDDGVHVIHCSKANGGCGSYGPPASSVVEAVNRWNRRK